MQNLLRSLLPGKPADADPVECASTSELGELLDIVFAEADQAEAELAGLWAAAEQAQAVDREARRRHSRTLWLPYGNTCVAAARPCAAGRECSGREPQRPAAGCVRILLFSLATQVAPEVLDHFWGRLHAAYADWRPDDYVVEGEPWPSLSLYTQGLTRTGWEHRAGCARQGPAQRSQRKCRSTRSSTPYPF